jgi:hypothetical protein
MRARENPDTKQTFNEQKKPIHLSKKMNMNFLHETRNVIIIITIITVSSSFSAYYLITPVFAVIVICILQYLFPKSKK